MKGDGLNFLDAGDYLEIFEIESFMRYRYMIVPLQIDEFTKDYRKKTKISNQMKKSMLLIKPILQNLANTGNKNASIWL